MHYVPKGCYDGCLDRLITDAMKLELAVLQQYKPIFSRNKSNRDALIKKSENIK